ncbi:MAG: thioredoxin-dependent thiol peroxidase [Gammaproteobacteria bacterium]
MLQQGDKAPDFSLAASNGKTVSLGDLKGRKVVLYFYPKDDTPGCTKEACSFRDYNAEIEQAGAVVLGVSTDGAKSHERFIGKYDLNFLLLSDPDHQMSEAYGAWGEKKNYGRTYMGTKRITYLIDEQGNVARAWPKVKPEGHGEEVLEAVKAA